MKKQHYKDKLNANYTSSYQKEINDKFLDELFDEIEKLIQGQDLLIKAHEDYIEEVGNRTCETCKYWDGDYCNKINITIDIGGCGDYWEKL